MTPYQVYMQKVAGMPLLAAEALHGAGRGALGGAVIGGLAGAGKDEEGNRHILEGAFKGALIGTAAGGAGGAALGAGLRHTSRVGMALNRGLAGKALPGSDEAKAFRGIAKQLRDNSKLPFAGIGSGHGLDHLASMADGIAHTI